MENPPLDIFFTIRYPPTSRPSGSAALFCAAIEVGPSANGGWRDERKSGPILAKRASSPPPFKARISAYFSRHHDLNFQHDRLCRGQQTDGIGCLADRNSVRKFALPGPQSAHHR